MVLRVSAIVESTIKSIDITAITWKKRRVNRSNGVCRELPALCVTLIKQLSLSLSLSLFVRLYRVCRFASECPESTYVAVILQSYHETEKWKITSDSPGVFSLAFTSEIREATKSSRRTRDPTIQQSLENGME